MTVIHEGTANLDSNLRENRVFEPSHEFRSKAHVSSIEQYEQMYRRSVEQPEEFWGEAASELEWFAPWTRVLEPGRDGSGFGAKWFTGGKLNLSHNCVDRHAKGARRDKVALLWEGEPGEVRKLTYGDLYAEVQRFANVLKGLGIKKGDRVAIYMGMCPELAIALLACARIGAVHSVIFGGFAAHAIVDRVNDSSCVAVITQDSSFRRGHEIHLKKIVDEALTQCPYRQERRRLPAQRNPRGDEGRPRYLVGRVHAYRREGVPGRVDGRRGSALSPLHIRNHR